MPKWSPVLLSVLRIVSALLFTLHGTQKVLGFPPAPPHPGGGHMEGIMGTLAPASGYLELIGGALLLIGLFSRWTAFILSGEMAVAYFMVHAPKGLYPLSQGGNGGELAVLYCFIFLYLFVAGPGPISVDGAVRRRL
jgi:putative oxidoreductase